MGALPTVRIVGPAGRMIVNETDLEMYRAKGYRLEGEAPSPAPAAEGDGTQEATQMTPLDRLTVAELRERADALGIEGYAGLKKADLIEAIIAADGE